MTLQRLLRGVGHRCPVISLFAVGGSSAYAQVAATNVPAGIQLSKDLGLADPSAEINITVHLKLNDKAAFDKAVDALSRPRFADLPQMDDQCRSQEVRAAESQRQSRPPGT